MLYDIKQFFLNTFSRFWNCIFLWRKIYYYGHTHHPSHSVEYKVSNTPPSCRWRRGFRWGYYGQGQDVVGVPWSLYRAVTAVRNRHAAALPPSSAVASLPQQSFVDRRVLQLFAAAAIVPRVSSRRLLLVYVCLCVYMCLSVCGALFFLL